MTNQKKHVAVIGCGYWGKNLIKAFAGLGVLAAVSDMHAPTAESFAAQYDCAALSWDAVLADKNITAVALATPAVLHAKMATEALNAGKHVFVEKPLALTVPDAEKVIVLAKQQSRVLMVGHILNYHPAFMKLKQMVEEGALGRVRHVISNRLSLGKVRHEEDVLWSFAPHDLSMILSLVGGEPTKVTVSKSAILQKDIADIGHIDLEFAGGVTAHVHASWISPFKEQKLTVIGDKAMAVFEDSLSYPDKLRFYPHLVDASKTPPAVEKKEFITIDVVESEPLRNECAHFTDCIANNKQPITDGEEGLRVLRILAQTSQEK
jgi:UDP-2-acetamido-3-amino-2,3-dideoxy-glucuronate N-acetyltransferase